MNQADLIGLVGRRIKNFSWFLGAGASASAGLSTATDILWDLKRFYYCQQEGQEITRQDVQSSAVASLIQDFMEARGFPSLGDPTEYTEYFEKLFTTKEKQRAYLHKTLSEDKTRLTAGCRVLAALMTSGNADTVFTTNFDTVIEKAVAEIAGKSLSAYHLEGPHSAKSALNNKEFPFYCKLHGDFRYDSLKNLSADLATQNTELGDCFVNAANQYGFIIAGYSGRDESVVALFHKALGYNNPFPHGLFWTGLKGSKAAPAVETLLEAARSKGITAEYVEIETYDTFMLRLWKVIDGKSPALDAKVRRTKVVPVEIAIPGPGCRQPTLRFNALPIQSLPLECSSLTFPTDKSWLEIRDAQRKVDGEIIVTKADTVLAWGTETVLRDAFSDVDTIRPRNLPPAAGYKDNLNILRFVEEGLCNALKRDRPILSRRIRDAAYLIVDAQSDDQPDLEPLFQEVGKTFGKDAILNAWLSILLPDTGGQSSISISAFNNGAAHENPTYAISRQLIVARGV